MIVPKAKKLPSGNWFINLRLGGQNIPVTEPTERRCIQQAQYIKAEYLAGKRQDAVKSRESPTLTAAIDAYIAKKKNILSPATIRGYKIIQENRFASLMSLKVDKITESIAQKAINDACLEYSAKTVCNSWRFISTVIRDRTDRTISVSLPQIIHKDISFLDPDQIKTFMSAVSGTDVEISALLALCSLRQSEILALQWEDVDLDNALVVVRASTVPDEDNKFVRKEETKNTSSRRVVPIMPQLVDVLRDTPHTADTVVTISASWMFRRINKICKANGLPEVGVHGLRHSFASLAYSLGMSEKITMEIGGWSDDATMKKIYTHIARADRLKAETAMSNFYKNLTAQDQSKD